MALIHKVWSCESKAIYFCNTDDFLVFLALSRKNEKKFRYAYSLGVLLSPIKVKNNNTSVWP